MLPIDKIIRVAVGDPSVADVNVLSEKELMLIAKGAGSTSLIIWDLAGKRSFNIIVSKEDAERNSQRVRELLVAADLRGLRVKTEEEKIYVIGEVLTQEELDKVSSLIKPFDRAVSLVEIKQRQPLVEIAINVLEISIDDMKQLGMDWSNNLPISYTESSTIDGKTPKFWKVMDWNRTTIDARLNFLIEEDKARTLANPKLITLSGKEAKFLVGGEVAYITEKDNQKTTAEWKEYGVNLKIKPQVNSKNEIRTTIEAEVSDLDWGNAVSHAGYSIPALRKRKVVTELFLNEEDTVFFAGLIKNEDSRNIERLPWLSKVPILGELFKSTDFRDKRTELVISLTPRIIRNSGDAVSNQMREQEAILASQRAFSTYSEEESPLTYYSHMIQDIITRNVSYPEESQAAQQEGIVKVDLFLLPSGQLKEVRVRESSGFSALDQAALAAVQKNTPYPSFPEQLNQPELRLTIPVVFKKFVQNQ